MFSRSAISELATLLSHKIFYISMIVLAALALAVAALIGFVNTFFTLILSLIIFFKHFTILKFCRKLRLRGKRRIERYFICRLNNR